MARLMPQEDVFSHGEVGRELEFLVDHGDAQAFRVRARINCDRLAHPARLARITRHFARQDLDQGGLSGTVFPH